MKKMAKSLVLKEYFQYVQDDVIKYFYYVAALDRVEYHKKVENVFKLLETINSLLKSGKILFNLESPATHLALAEY